MVDPRELIAVLKAHRPSSHEIWGGDIIYAAPSRIEYLKKIKQKGIDKISYEELDWLLFKCKSTVGTENTFFYLLPDAFEVLLNDESGVFSDEYGLSLNPDFIFRKLFYCKFRNRPAPVQEAALKLCLFFGEKEEENSLVKDIKKEISAEV